MPNLDAMFSAFMACRSKTEAEVWLDREIAYYLAHDPAPYRARTLTQEDARRAILGHLSLNAGYCGKAVVDRVSEFFGEGWFMDLGGRDYAVCGVVAAGKVAPPALKWHERAVGWFKRYFSI